MLIFLTTLLASLASIFRSRASLENLAFTPSNRRAPQVCRKTPQIDLGRPPAVDLSVAPLARLALGVGHRQARNGRSLASCRLSFVLDLEGALRKTRTTRHFKRSPRSDSQDVLGESRLGCTGHPRQTALLRSSGRHDAKSLIACHISWYISNRRLYATYRKAFYEWPKPSRALALRIPIRGR